MRLGHVVWVTRPVQRTVSHPVASQAKLLCIACLHSQQCTFYICSVILLWEHYEDFLETAAYTSEVQR